MDVDQRVQEHPEWAGYDYMYMLDMDMVDMLGGYGSESPGAP